ncbi:hypothetical protein Bca52824_010148 [Brassica carinata]|uniref:Ubiquitin-like protease family profile domain-containing protein n=1 Tax=Brassica carinata TaxID=52824 RepID=A0A8X7WEI6_BRACI|nr:hypothetical protein Bca52824_010148 [Brassica carinata]
MGRVFKVLMDCEEIFQVVTLMGFAALSSGCTQLRDGCYLWSPSPKQSVSDHGFQGGRGEPLKRLSSRQSSEFGALISQMSILNLAAVIGLLCGSKSLRGTLFVFVVHVSPRKNFDEPEPFTYERLEDLPQARAGDCGVYAVKYIECHALGMPFSKKEFAKNKGKAIRDKMAVDIFEELHGVHRWENGDGDENYGAYGDDR